MPKVAYPPCRDHPTADPPPSAGLYLVTTEAGEPIVGNVVDLPVGVLTGPGVVETTYKPPGDTGQNRRALARNFALAGGFRLLVGHDLAEGESLRPILGQALLTSFAWLIFIGTLGGLSSPGACSVASMRSAPMPGHRRGRPVGRFPLTGTGDELDRLVDNLNAMLARIAT